MRPNSVAGGTQGVSLTANGQPGVVVTGTEGTGVGTVPGVSSGRPGHGAAGSPTEPTDSADPLDAATTTPGQRRDQRVALVGGRAIGRGELMERLVEAEGAKMLDLIVELELARQMSARAGLETNPEELENFQVQLLTSRLRLASPQLKAGGTDPAQMQALGREIRRRAGPVAELQAEKIYHLDRLARQLIQVDDDELREEYNAQYGQKLRLRWLVLNTHADAAALSSRLRAGEDFATVAARLATDNGPGFVTGDPVPVAKMAEVFRRELTALKAGEVSRPLLMDSKYFVMQLLEKIPATDVNFAQVADRLRESVTQRKVRETMQRLYQELRRAKLDVTFLDERLRLREDPAGGLDNWLPSR